MLKLTATIVIAVTALAAMQGAALAGKPGTDARAHNPTGLQLPSSQNHDHWNSGRPYCIVVRDDNGHLHPRCAAQ